jgi:hypothetical protein
MDNIMLNQLKKNELQDTIKVAKWFPSTPVIATVREALPFLAAPDEYTVMLPLWWYDKMDGNPVLALAGMDPIMAHPDKSSIHDDWVLVRRRNPDDITWRDEKLPFNDHVLIFKVEDTNGTNMP